MRFLKRPIFSDGAQFPSLTSKAVLGTDGSGNVIGGVTPTVVVSLSAVTSNYHQAMRVIAQGTYTEPAVPYRLVVQVSGYVNGADYSGAVLAVVVGIPAGGTVNCGGIIGDESNQQGTGGGNPTTGDVIGTARYPDTATRGVRGATVKLGTILGEFAGGCLQRQIIYPSVAAGTTLTVQILEGEVSGFETALAPSGSSGHTWSNVALSPTYDTSPDSPSPGQGFARDLWVLDVTAGALLRYSIGRRSLARYEGVQPRLLYRGQVALTGQTVTFGRVAIDKNGIACVSSAAGNMVTLVNTTSSSHAGAVLVTTGSLGGNIDDAVPAPDGTGFWVAVDNVGLKKINPTTGAVITTIALAGYGTIHLDLDPTGVVAYIWASAYPGVITVNLATSALTTGPALASVNSVKVSPDGTALLLTSNAYQTWVVAKVPLPTAPTGPASGVTVTYASRVGTQLANLQAYSIAISADSKMFFFAGLNGIFGYGWVSNMAIWDGTTAEVANAPTGYVTVTENDGIYVAESGGTGTGLPAAKVKGWPGSTFTCDPVGTNNGEYFAEVLLA